MEPYAQSSLYTLHTFSEAYKPQRMEENPRPSHEKKSHKPYKPHSLSDCNSIPILINGNREPLGAAAAKLIESINTRQEDHVARWRHNLDRIPSFVPRCLQLNGACCPADGETERRQKHPPQRRSEGGDRVEYTSDRRRQGDWSEGEEFGGGK